MNATKARKTTTSVRIDVLDRQSNPTAYVAYVTPGESVTVIRSEMRFTATMSRNDNVVASRWLESLTPAARADLIRLRLDDATPAEVMGDWIEENGGQRQWAEGFAVTSRTYKMGERAEYHSYNLNYFGEITSITAKTVTINAGHAENRRLSLYEFCWRNWSDPAPKLKSNREWTD